MKRSAPGLLLLLLLLLPTSAWAQPSAADRRTGLAPAESQLGPDQIRDYVRAVDSLTTEIEWETRGDSRRELNASRIRMTAVWERPRPGAAPVLVGATIRPVAGGRLHFGGERINKVTINRKGEIRIDRKGIDITVYKVTRKRNGDLVLDLPWWAFGDKTIKASDLAGIDIRNWPPTLEEVVDTLMADRPQDDQTRHEGTISWRLSGRARETALPVAGGDLRAATRFDVRGAGVLAPDGSFRTIGAANRATLELTVGDTRYRKGSGNLDAAITSGRARFDGRYAISVPADDAGAFALTVDGRVDYAVDASSIRMSVPSGARIRAGHTILSGDGRLVSTVGPGGAAMMLRDGTYRFTLDGPVGVSGLRVDPFTIDDIVGTGTVTSSGTVEELSTDRLLVSGGVNGDLAVRSRGIRGVLENEDSVTGTIGEGSRVRFDLPETRADVTLPGRPGRDVKISASTAGTASGELVVEDARYRGEGAEAEVGRVTASFDLDVEGGASQDPELPWLRRARGTASARVDEPGTLTYTGLPGAPVVPASSQRRHRVVSGDSLSKLADRYGVTVAALREANGIPASSSLIRVGEELTIPGQAAPRPSAVVDEQPGRWSTALEPGSRVDVEVDDASVGPGGLRARGHVAATLLLRGSDVRAGRLEAEILGAARATLGRTAFSIAPGEDGRTHLETGPIRVPVRIELDRGSTVNIDVPGRETSLAFDRDGSYAEFTVSVIRGQDGRLRVDELQQADLLLHSSGAASFAGEAADVAGDKTIRYTGRVAFVARGMDFYGDIAITIRGREDVPAVRIRW